MIWLINLQLIF